MNDDLDIEKALRRGDHGPSQRTKGAVMARYAEMSGRLEGKRAAWWRRPVPFYRVAAALIILAAVSFAAGNRLGNVSLSGAPDSRQSSSSVLAGDTLQWVAAKNDCL